MKNFKLRQVTRTTLVSGAITSVICLTPRAGISWATRSQIILAKALNFNWFIDRAHRLLYKAIYHGCIYGNIWQCMGCNRQNFNFLNKLLKNFIFKRAKNYEAFQKCKHTKKFVNSSWIRITRSFLMKLWN